MEKVQQEKKEFAKPHCPCPRNHGVFPKPCPGTDAAAPGWTPRRDGCCLCLQGMAAWAQRPCTSSLRSCQKATASLYFGSYPQHHFSVAKFSWWKADCSHRLRLVGRGRGCSADPGPPAQPDHPWLAVPKPHQGDFWEKL